jgi:cystathionine beta-synthase
MADYGFLSADGQQTIGDVLARKPGGSLPSFVHTHPTETVREAIDILREYGVSQMPVVRAEPPVMTPRSSGPCTTATCSTRCSPAGRAGRPAGRPHGARRCRWSAPGEPVQAAMTALEKADAAVVVADGRPTGVITRQDVLAFLSG